ncbi:MAG: PaaI family thioesterase [Pontixanthobacter sp.]
MSAPTGQQDRDAGSPAKAPTEANAETNPGADLHYRALERLYGSAPVNDLFQSELAIMGEGLARVEFQVTEQSYHAAGAAHGTIYFKMLDDAAFYAANTLVTDRFLLTTSFNLHFTKPVRVGPVTAEGHWVSGRRRVFVAESRLIDSEGDEIGRGTGTFMRSHIPLSGLAGYGSR